MASSSPASRQQSEVPERGTQQKSQVRGFGECRSEREGKAG